MTIWTDYYCTPSGGGLHDGTSEANAWTWNEARGSLSPGDRLNVKAGTHNVGSVNGTATDHGTTSAPIWFRGYTSTPGDLDGVSINGLQNGVDIPLISRTGNSYERLYCNYAMFTHIAFTSDSTSYAGIYPSGNGQTWKDCRVTRTNTVNASQALIAIDQAAQSFYSGCEFIDSPAGSNTYAAVNMSSYSTLDSCYVEVQNTSQKGVDSNRYTHVANCVIVGGGTGCRIHSSGNNNIFNCTFYNQATTAIDFASTTLGSRAIVNNLIHTCPTGILRTGTYANAMVDNSLLNNSFYNVTTNISGVNYDGYSHETITETSDPLVDPANGDFRLAATASSYTTGFPKVIGGLTNKADRGVFAAASSGSGATIHPLYQN